MSKSITTAEKTIKIIDNAETVTTFGATEQFALDVLVGLSETRKTLSSKYMYDDEGSRLFKQITQLDEYYPTRCERNILEIHKEAIGEFVKGEPFNLVEFGSGDGHKTNILLEHFQKEKLDFRYVPIDISHQAIEEQMHDLTTRYPDLSVNGLVSDYFTGIKWLNSNSRRRNLVLFLGSNIGNFNHAGARTFLRNLWSSLHNNDMVLIGFDLKKDIEMLLAAYNDSQGITSKFNLNVLNRINRELGGHFKLDCFRHFGTYDVFSGAMESYLVSLRRQEVFIDHIGRSFHFRPWEPIHLEYSYKYLKADIKMLAMETGYEVLDNFSDASDYFIDSVWRVIKADHQ